MSESRTGKRFPIKLPITIRDVKTSRRHRALTKDLSAAGVAIQGGAPLRVGSRIEFEIKLPGKVIGIGRDVELLCRGRVVRSEAAAKGKGKKKGKAQSGLACVIDQYKFIRRK